jgi:hypothetical protein
MRLLVKVSFIIVALGAMGLGLLALRQQRYEVSNQISRAHARIVDQGRAIWRMQAEVARRTDPRDIRDAAATLHIDLEPIQPPAAEGSAQAAAGERTAVTLPTNDSPAAKAEAPKAVVAGKKNDTGAAAKKPAAATPAGKKKPAAPAARKDAAAATRKDATHGH